MPPAPNDEALAERPAESVHVERSAGQVQGRIGGNAGRDPQLQQSARDARRAAVGIAGVEDQRAGAELREAARVGGVQHAGVRHVVTIRVDGDRAAAVDNAIGGAGVIDGVGRGILQRAAGEREGAAGGNRPGISHVERAAGNADRTIGSMSRSWPPSWSDRFSSRNGSCPDSGLVGECRSSIRSSSRLE